MRFLVKHGGDVPQDLRDEINNVIGGAVAVGIAPSTGAHAVETDSPDPVGHTSSVPHSRVLLFNPLFDFGGVSNISVSDTSRN